jgi:hypothetical protein
MQTANVINHDSQFLKIEIFQNLNQHQGKMMAGKWKNETIIYLYHFPEYSIDQKIAVGSIVSMKNNSNFAILNVSIYSKDVQKEVLTLKTLSPNQSIQFEFNKEGSFDLSYSIADNQKIEKRIFKVVSQPRKQPKASVNFDPQLKPAWY